MRLDSPVTEVKGVGAAVAQKLAILGVSTTRDLINYYPRRYDDYSNLQDISTIRPGIVTIKAVIKQAKGRYMRTGLHITEAVASDATSSVRLVWFNQSYRAAALKPGSSYYISGEFGLHSQRLSITNPSVELVSDFPINTARIVPIYRQTKGLSSLQIRRAIREVMPSIRDLPEILPDWVIASHKLLPRSAAVETMHFPSSAESLVEAQRSLGFEEVFELSLAALLNKYELMQEETLQIPFNQKLAKQFVEHLPFKLTDAQRKVVWQIYQDIQKPQPMNRLIEGDVGSGKTVVAAMAAVMAIKEGFQVAFMAPTELLARQHAETLYKLLEPLGVAERVGLLIGGLSAAQKKLVQKRIADGEVGFIVGTHALIQEKVDMHKLGLVIVDEQHRFGVEQRKALQAKAGHAVHTLHMTATPIPRSLALTLYGELDISIIDTKPANRKPIVTKIATAHNRTKVYQDVDKQIQDGRQAFVVCPLITDSDSLDSKSVEAVYEELNRGIFKHRRLGLLHGKLKSDEKDSVMRAFVNHELDMLVSTTVIEVGVDVPNATAMIIESAERFGLAQMHQLRGRVGRSSHQGYCYLMVDGPDKPSRRLKALVDSQDGFELAELDLDIRGPGAIYGSMQHGLLDLRVAKLSDTKLIAEARAAAQAFIDKKDNLVQYKELHAVVRSLRAVTSLN